MSRSQTIYSILRNAGCTEAGALGLMGNWMAESGLEPWRLQNDFTAGRILSRTYTADVASGKITREQFARDQKGYGLAQWTYFNFNTGQGRKLALYDFWKKSGKALDDVSMQTEFALHELRTEGQYTGLWSFLRKTDDLYAATDKVCRLYEQPYYCNVDARYKYAQDLQKELHGYEVAQDEPETDEEGIPIPKTWPPRTIDSHCTGWPEVWLIQSLLKCRGYNTLIDGIWGSVLQDRVQAFQKENGLDADGVAGPMTWAALMKTTST